MSEPQKVIITQANWDSIKTIESPHEPYRFERGGKQYVHHNGSDHEVIVDDEMHAQMELKKKHMQARMSRESWLRFPMRRHILELNAPSCPHCENGGFVKLRSHLCEPARWKCSSCKHHFVAEPKINMLPEYMNEKKPETPNRPYIKI